MKEVIYELFNDIISYASGKAHLLDTICPK